MGPMRSTGAVRMRGRVMVSMNAKKNMVPGQMSFVTKYDGFAMRKEYKGKANTSVESVNMCSVFRITDGFGVSFFGAVIWSSCGCLMSGRISPDLFGVQIGGWNFG